ncbi:MAG TPA: hypothetical protein VGJ56_17050 [Reyranella sp.]|jgi:hypothetical protein
MRISTAASPDPSGHRRGRAGRRAKRPSTGERLAAGKALRCKAPRSSHADWKPRSDRPDPVSILERQNATRVSKLVPIWYARTLVTPFTFLRGSATSASSAGAAWTTY